VASDFVISHWVPPAKAFGVARLLSLRIVAGDLSDAGLPARESFRSSTFSENLASAIASIAFSNLRPVPGSLMCSR
jgi:hypothetical protein